ncbi:MAG: hypothetical protein RLZZ01_60, partial [Actinomycetota bacterium]
MAEHFLDDAEVGTVVEQVCRTRVTEYMRRETITETDAIAVLAQDEPGTLAAQTTTGAIQEHRLGIAATPPAGRRQRSPPGQLEPFVERTRSSRTV